MGTILQELNSGAAELAAIIDSTLDAIITIDENQKIVLFNSAAEKLFLCSSKDARGGPIDRFIPERFRLVYQQYIRQLGKDHGPPRMMGSPGELYGLRTSGEQF